MAVIASRANPRVKAIRALANKGERQRAGVFFAEGAQLLSQALRAGAGIEAVVVVPDRLRAPADRDLIATARATGAEVIELSPEAYDSLSFRGDPDCIGAVVKMRKDTLPATGEGFWVAVHEIQHPGNLGALIRTSGAAGGAGVILTGDSTDPYHPVAVRGSLGAIFSQPVVQTDQHSFEAWLRESTARVIGTSPAGKVDYRAADYRGPLVVLSGNERAGLTEAQLALCDQVVRVPMYGSVDSLNLSIATALVLFEAARQRE